MWKIFAFLVHVVLLGYVYVIYFQSNLLHGMKPQSALREFDLQPPADRLVVFITDGLRAESFFRKNCGGVPSIQKIMMQEGLTGIAHTCAPTQSRPGHISIFGGFNEGPSAALTNFKKNLGVFDTVFNRTKGTWGWGGSYVLQMFIDLPNAGKPLNFHLFQTSELNGSYSADSWVFGKVRKFLDSKDNIKQVQDTIPSMFLVYLGDLDVAGHYKKPNTDFFLEVLNNTQAGIGQTHELFESTFKDKRTVYLMISDHGMTDHGSHGSDSKLETEVPFVLWGAGANRVAPNKGRTFKVNDVGLEMPLHELEQTQMAPLMSALIGLPPPMNNRAMLPLGYMNVSETYEAYSLHLNVLQLLAQVERMMQTYQRGYLSEWLPRFERLDKQRIRHYHHQFFRQMQLDCMREAKECSQDMIRLALDYLEYYRNYYRIPLYVACVLTYLGWFYYLLAKQARPINGLKQDWFSVPVILIAGLEILLGIMLYLHKVPRWTSFYLLVPLPVWIVAVRERGLHCKCVVAPLQQLAWIVGTAAWFISTNFYRELVSLGYVLAVCINNRLAFKHPTMKFGLWLLLVALLAGFTLKRPDLGYENHYLLYLSMVLTFLRPLVMSERHGLLVWLTNGSALLLGGYIVHLVKEEKPICPFLHGAAWCYMVYALISIPYSNTKTPGHRVQLILFNLSTIYTLLCLSYESIFMQILCLEFLMGVQVHDKSKQLEDADNDEEDDKPAKIFTPVQKIHSSYRYALLILFDTYLSIIGTGNLPAVNSFDPNTPRVFVREFYPILMGSLIVLKFFIPTIIIMSSIYAFCPNARHNVRGIFIALFLICDAMCLYVLFFVRNFGEWSHVRSSLSQLLIVHGLPILLICICWVPKNFLSAIPVTMLPMLRWKSEVRLPRSDESHA